MTDACDLAMRLREIAGAWLDPEEQKEVYAVADELDRLAAVETAAREYIAARAERTVAPPVTRVDARRHIKRAYAALAAAVDKP